MSRTRDPLTAAQRRHEAWIARFILAVCAVTAAFELWRVANGDPGGWTVLAIVVPISVWYGIVWAWCLRALPPWWVRVFHVAVEALGVTLVLVFEVLNATYASAFAGGTAYAYPLAIGVSALRLSPALSLWSGALCAASLLATAAFFQPETLPLASLGLPYQVLRAAFLLLLGFLGFVVARSLRRLVLQVTSEVESRERLRGALGFYVPDALVDRVLDGDLTLQTERRHVSVLFVDIRGFTTMSETADPAALLDRLNAVLDRFAQEVQAHDGIVNKFLGDGLMALFGAPQHNPDHAERAVRAALAMRDAARRLDADGTFPGLRIGVGVHCGEVVVGDVGGESHREYTAIGDVVNVAARVESATKDLDQPVLVTEAVAGALGEGWVVEALAPVQLKGREQPVCMYAVRHDRDVTASNRPQSASAEPASTT